MGDGNSLYLKVMPNGSKFWLSRPTNPEGKRTNIHIGQYPEVSLTQARELNVEVLQAARLGRTIPTVKDFRQQELQEVSEEQKEKEARSFLSVSKEWLESYEKTRADSTYRKARLVVEDYLQPVLADIDVGLLATKDVYQPVRQIEDRAPELAKKALTYLNGIMDLAILKGYREEDKVLRTRGILTSRKTGHYPAVTKERDVGKLMRLVYDYKGYVVSQA